jgi:hypothetical protein
MLRYVALALMATLVQSAHADVICVKNSQRISVSRAKVTVRLPSLMTTSASTCPSGYTQLTEFVRQETNRTSFTGVWNLASPTGGSYAAATVSFPEPLSTAPTETIFVRSGISNSTCTGTVSNPTAPPGVLCVYEGVTLNMAAGVRYNMYSGTDAWDGNASARGGAMYGYPDDSSAQFYAWGSWAVTKP